MPRSYVFKIELGVAVVVALIGCFFIYQASMIRPALNDPIGPRVLPMFLAITLVFGAALIAVTAFLSIRKPGGADDEIPMTQSYGFLQSNVPLIFAVIGCGIVYVASFWAFGYFVATFLSVVLIMVTFGNRKWLLILTIALGVAMLYQFVFMGLMGLFDPAGEIVDLRKYTNWISGVQ